MPFKKGNTGKPQGAVNIAGTGVKAKISKFLDKKMDYMLNQFDDLPPREQVRLFTELMKYTEQKLAPKKDETRFESMTDAELDAIIAQLQEAALPSVLRINDVN
jgi:predicted metal-dependent hydrolase